MQGTRARTHTHTHGKAARLSELIVKSETWYGLGIIRRDDMSKKFDELEDCSRCQSEIWIFST